MLGVVPPLRGIPEHQNERRPSKTVSHNPSRRGSLEPEDIRTPYQPTSAPLTRTGSPLLGRRPSSAFGSTTAGRSQQARQYHGKEWEPSQRGSVGPGMYNVRVSRTGSPIMGRPSSAFGKATLRRSQSAASHPTKGGFGPGGYDVRTSRHGSPLWKRPSSTFGATTAPRERPAKQYAGKEWEATQRGKEGPSYYDVKVSRTGTPRLGGKGTPIFGEAPTASRTPSAAAVLTRQYVGKEFEGAQRGLHTYCSKVGYDVSGAIGKQALSTRKTGRSCSFGHADRDVFTRLYQGNGVKGR